MLSHLKKRPTCCLVIIILKFKGKQNQRNSPDAAWTETWDDLTTCQDLISVLKQKMDL